MDQTPQTAVSTETRAGEALSVRRLFTQPGVHPFETVEWELRDARIGSVFEQKDVEFPTSWSQNSTNIVAQKYFRGQLDSPARERSVKQMVGRVAGTIADWGRQRGYFASVEDGDTFEAELSYILLHQMAAFNSPVWFNVGFEESPQASACFILSVDDTIESILEWNTNEGMIFRGGSGSGINLSNIRGSMEPLSKGGTASGPVSFMRGADAWAGTIKCLAEGTEVMTERGVRAIEDVEPGEHVLTRFGPRQVLAAHSNGVKPLVRVTTELGNEILCTAEHRFLVRTREGDEVWREAGAIEPNDHLMLDLGQVEFGQLQSLEQVERGHHRERDIVLPQVLHEHFARWLGWIYGDGNITHRPPTTYVGLQIADSDRDLLGAYRMLVAQVFGDDVHLCAHVRRDREDASSSLRLASTRLVRFLRTNGLTKTGSRPGEIAIPNTVKSSPSEVRAAFLSGLFEADGSVVSGYPTLSTVSHELALDVHRLLLSIGIPSKLRRVDDRTGAFGTRPLHTVRVVSLAGIARFEQFVGFLSARKRRVLAAAVARTSKAVYETDWALPHAVAELDELWHDADQPLRRALAPYCRYSRPHALSGLRATALLNEHPELCGTVVGRAASPYIYYTRAAVEPAGVGPVHDITVADAHEYLVHNVVTHNSGGKTRRAAKMVVLDVDHPDIRDFIWCKALEEDKAAALREAGFDMSIDGDGFQSIQYQNANNSVRLTDEFMHAVENDADWQLIARSTGEPTDTTPARELMREIAEAAWRCADPGVQYDTTINQWHTSPNSGRINASNPCFPATARVHTTQGLLSIGELVERGEAGEDVRVYTHRATAEDPGDGVVATRPVAFMRNGVKPIVRLRFANGGELRCTPNHRIWTLNRGYVRADELTADDQIMLNDSATPAEDASWELPVKVAAKAASWSRGGSVAYAELPERWSEGLGEVTGHLIGDGCLTDVSTVFVYGQDDVEDCTLEQHDTYLYELFGGGSRQDMDNGTVQLRVGSSAVREFMRGLGVTSARAHDKRVPESIFTAPPEIQSAFLRGLYGADGCVSRLSGNKGYRYVGLGSRSDALLRDVQKLLGAFGIRGSIYSVSGSNAQGKFSYVRKDGTEVTYASRQGYDLRITGSDLERFSDAIGFSTRRKNDALTALLSETTRYASRRHTTLAVREDDGQEQVFNLTEPLHHSYIVDNQIVANCSEYMHVDDSACNLASLNLMKFRRPDGTLDVERFNHTVDIIFLAQEIVVGPSSYPTEEIAGNARAFRQLGLGYANLGAYLMSNGLAYDSDGGRGFAASITALMTGRGYLQSAKVAAAIGPYDRYAGNREAHNNVMRMHRDASYAIPDATSDDEALLASARETWNEAVALGELYGYRNAQATVLAPTGTISFLMDCDTTGVEPDFSLVKYKELVGGGTMTIVNRTVPMALRTLGYSDAQVEQIEAHINEHGTIVGAPGLAEEHLPVFDVAVGARAISHMGHIKMMGAVQPFLSGAISKTVNLPQTASVEDIADAYLQAWRLGIKALAIYRDGSKTAQALRTDAQEAKQVVVQGYSEEQVEALVAARVEDAVNAAVAAVKADVGPARKRMPRERQSITHKFSLGGHEGYITAGMYEDGTVGEIFLTDIGKEGSTLRGMMNSFATAISIALQYGVPLETLVRKFAYMRFEPEGITTNPEIPFAKSMPDYIMRWLASRFLDADVHEDLGILTPEVRARKAGEEVVTASPGGTNGSATVQTDQPTAGAQGTPPAPPLQPGDVQPPTAALTDTPPVHPARMVGLDLGPACTQCGGMMQRTGSCYTCSSCGNNTGCG